MLLVKALTIMMCPKLLLWIYFKMDQFLLMLQQEVTGQVIHREFYNVQIQRLVILFY